MIEARGDDTEQAARAKNLAAVGLSVQAGLAALLLGVSLVTGSFAALGAAAHVLAGAGAWAAGALLASRRRKVVFEREEEDRLARVAASEGRRPLFDRGAHGEGSDARLGGALALLLALGEIALGALVIAFGVTRQAPPLERLLGGSAALAGSAFGLLLLAKYTIALSAGSAKSPLALATAGGRRAASGALVAFAAAVALALNDLAPKLEVDRAGFLFAGLEVALGIELALGLLLELYRPRRKGEVPRPAFESRLLALVAEPSGIARSLARAIDYQFGFRLSETWVYRLVERGLAPLAIFAAASFWLLSCLVVIPQDERGILERLGTPGDAALEPGLHFKLPWPIETVNQFKTSRVREVVLGPDEDDDVEEAKAGKRAVLWTRAHSKESEFFILVARASESPGDSREAPVDLLSARIPVHFIVSNPVEFAKGAATPERLLKALGERELAALGCSRGVFQLLSEGNGEAGLELQRRIQESADAHHLGVRVLDVSLADLHPPIEVAAAFQKETGAIEDREAQRLRELAYAARLRPETEGRSRAILDQAQTDAARKKKLAEADASRFRALINLDRIAPRTFRTLRMLRGLEDSLSGPQRKVIVARGVRGAVNVDLGEKISAEELGLSEPRK